MQATRPFPAALFLSELHAEAAATRRLFERLPEQHLGWKPHPKCFTLGQQAWHIATVPSGFARMLAVDTFDFATLNLTARQPETVAEILAALAQGQADCDAAFGSWSDADLAQPWRCVNGARELMTLAKGEALRKLIANHVIHHRGQVALYLRLLDVPLPALYGPTADENPFA